MDKVGLKKLATFKSADKRKSLKKKKPILKKKNTILEDTDQNSSIRNIKKPTNTDLKEKRYYNTYNEQLIEFYGGIKVDDENRTDKNSENNFKDNTTYYEETLLPCYLRCKPYHNETYHSVLPEKQCCYISCMCLDEEKGTLVVSSVQNNNISRYQIIYENNENMYLRADGKGTPKVCEPSGFDGTSEKNKLLQMCLVKGNFVTIDHCGQIKEFEMKGSEFYEPEAQKFSHDLFHHKINGMVLSNCNKYLIVWDKGSEITVIEIKTKEIVWKKSFYDKQITTIGTYNVLKNTIIMVGYEDGHMEQISCKTSECFYDHGIITKRRRAINKIVYTKYGHILLFDSYLHMYEINKKMKLKQVYKKVRTSRIIEAKTSKCGEFLYIVSLSEIKKIDLHTMTTRLDTFVPSIYGEIMHMELGSKYMVQCTEKAYIIMDLQTEKKAYYDLQYEKVCPEANNDVVHVMKSYKNWIYLVVGGSCTKSNNNLSLLQYDVTENVVLNSYNNVHLGVSYAMEMTFNGKYLFTSSYAITDKKYDANLEFKKVLVVDLIDPTIKLPEFDIQSFSNLKQWRIDPELGCLEEFAEYKCVSRDPIYSMKVCVNNLWIIMIDYNSTPIVQDIERSSIMKDLPYEPMLEGVKDRSVITWDITPSNNYLVFANSNQIFLVPLHIYPKEDKSGEHTMDFGTEHIEKQKESVMLEKILESPIVSIKCGHNNGKHIYVLTMNAKIIQFIIDEENDELIYQKHTKIRTDAYNHLDPNGCIVFFNSYVFEELVTKDDLPIGNDELQNIKSKWEKSNIYLIGKKTSKNIKSKANEQGYIPEIKSKHTQFIIVYFNHKIVIMARELQILNIIDTLELGMLPKDHSKTKISHLNHQCPNHVNFMAYRISNIQNIDEKNNNFWLSMKPRTPVEMMSDNNQLLIVPVQASQNKIFTFNFNDFIKVNCDDKLKVERQKVMHNINYDIWDSYSPSLDIKAITYFNYSTNMNFLSSILLKYLYPATLKKHNLIDLYYQSCNTAWSSQLNKLLYYVISILQSETVKYDDENKAAYKKENDSYNSKNQKGENSADAQMEDLKSRIFQVERIVSDKMIEKFVYSIQMKYAAKIFENFEQILEQYRRAKIISEYDVIVMIYTLLMLDLKLQIPVFMNTVMSNTTAIAPSFRKISNMIYKCSNNVIESSINLLAKNQFKLVTEFTNCNKRLLEQQYILSSKTVKGFGERQDNKVFCLSKGEKGPIVVDLYKFNIPIKFQSPNDEFLQYLRALQQHLDPNNEEVWCNKIFETWLQKLWSYYCKQMQLYLAVSLIPILSNFIMCFYLSHEEEKLKDNMNTLKTFAFITIVSSTLLAIYEIMQLLASGLDYFADQYNILDVITQCFAQTSSCYLLTLSKPNDINTDLLSVTQFLQFFKLFSNLKAIDSFRQFANKIVRVILSLYAFFIIVALFLLCFTNIFYVTDFYQGEDSKPDWWLYLMYTYYIFFAAWTDPSPPSNFEWVKFFFVVFTILFTIVVFNILIAILSDQWAELTDKNQIDDNRDILAMLSEVIEMRVWVIKNCRCTRRNRNKKDLVLTLKNMYLVFRKEEIITAKEEFKHQPIFDDSAALSVSCNKFQSQVNNYISVCLVKCKLFFSNFECQFAFTTDTQSSNDTMSLKMEGEHLEKKTNSKKSKQTDAIQRNDMKVDVNNIYEIINEIMPQLNMFSSLDEQMQQSQKEFEEADTKITQFEEQKLKSFRNNIGETSNLFNNVVLGLKSTINKPDK